MIHTRRMLWLSKRYQYPVEEHPVDTETKRSNYFQFILRVVGKNW
jgi:hypothetical protein